MSDNSARVTIGNKQFWQYSYQVSSDMLESLRGEGGGYVSRHQVITLTSYYTLPTCTMYKEGEEE